MHGRLLALLTPVALALVLAAACSSHHAPEPDPASKSPPVHVVSTLPAAVARDYEGLVRKLYADEPDYEKRWPVEFKVRVIEGLLQDLAGAAFDLGDQMGAPYFADHVDFGWATPNPEQPLIDGIKVTPFTPPPPRPRTATEIRDETAFAAEASAPDAPPPPEPNRPAVYAMPAAIGW